MSVKRKVTAPVGSVEKSGDRSLRSDRSCPVMNPTGTMPYFFAAFSSRRRACSLAASFSNLTRSNRPSAARTWASSLIGRRRRPSESM
jgi:hypothetical protein